MVVARTQKRGDYARSKIYEVVSSNWTERQTAPTIREIAAATGYSIATVHRHVQVLVAQRILYGKGRTLRPIHAVSIHDPDYTEPA